MILLLAAPATTRIRTPDLHALVELYELLDGARYPAR